MVKLSKYLPTNIKNKYVKLLKECKDVFVWTYEYLKTYDTSIIKHKIPLKLGINPFKKKI
jgi:hypothetical protein